MGEASCHPARALGVLVTGVILACGGPVPSRGDDRGDGPDSPPDPGPAHDEIGETPDAATSDWSRDSGRDATTDPATDGKDPCERPKEDFCPCGGNPECLGGYCVVTDEGRLCTSGCAPGDADCLEAASARCNRSDWAVQEVSTAVFGTLWVCLPLHPRLCRPCVTDEDCASHVEAVCAPYGLEGSFCATRCDHVVTCPEGYDCLEIVRGSTDRVTACILAGGQCPCSPLSVSDGASTRCGKSNTFGTCTGTRVCAADGLSPCDAKEPRGETCDGEDDDCDGATDEGFPDTDSDGVPDCLDPDDDDDGVPDGLDDCPFAHDPGQPDLDGDGIGDACDEDLDGDGDPNTTDCAPLGHAVHHGATEECNGLDDNCDGVTDEMGASCTWFFEDKDGDGFGVGGGRCLCAAAGPYSAVNNADCDDGNSAAHPGAIEACNGDDDDCDGVLDPEGSAGCTTWYQDADGDGWGAPQAKCLCAPAGTYTAAKSGDCHDGNASVHPQAAETCNGSDDDCDGQTDPPGTCGSETTYKVCLDPGHGGSDPGAVGYVVEKDVTLDICLRLRDLLNQDTSNPAGGGAWKVYMTRDSDVYVSLQSRVDYANSKGVDRFISTHNNACDYCGGHGTETYWYTAGSAESHDLATRIQDRVHTLLGTQDRGVKQANFYVLKYTSMPAVLVEVAFVDHPDDAAKLADPSMRQQAARGEMHGLQQHFGVGEFDP